MHKNHKAAVVIFLLFLCSSAASANSNPNLCQNSSSDLDGDGWGWENDASCIVSTQPTQPTQPTLSLDCVDTAPIGDGWGWNGVSSCQVHSNQEEVTTTSTCIDTPPTGDGWGWNGSSSCRVISNQEEVATPSNCVDTAPIGDGWGWNGSSSCRTTNPAPQELNVFVPDGGSHYSCGANQHLVFVPPANVQDADGTVLGRFEIDEDDLEFRVGSSVYNFRINGLDLIFQLNTGNPVIGTNSCQYESGPILQPIQLTSDAGYICSPYNDATSTWLWDFREDGLFDENGINTGTWLKLKWGNEIVVVPDGNEVVKIKELSDRTLRLFNNEELEWGYCETTKAADIPNVAKAFYCYGNPVNIYTVYNNNRVKVSAIRDGINFRLATLVDSNGESYLGVGAIETSKRINLSSESLEYYSGGYTDRNRNLPAFRIGTENFVKLNAPVYNRVFGINNGDATVCPALIE